jgi:very-short-patch-repair endonuclease
MSDLGRKRRLPEELLTFARELRSNHTDAETVFWSAVRSRRLMGLKFRRQHPVPPYFLDFYCHEHRLCVEIDGGQHQEESALRRDAERTEFLESSGIRILRFSNPDVLQNLEGVLVEICKEVGLIE